MNDTQEPLSPQHDKARPHLEEMQNIGEFVEWLTDTKHIKLCKYENPTEANGYEKGFWPVHYNIQELLAEFFDIDYKAYQAEKEAAYQYVSAIANARTTTPES